MYLLGQMNRVRGSQNYSCVSNNSLVYNKWFSWGIFKDPRRLLDTLLNKFIRSVPNKQFFGAKDLM